MPKQTHQETSSRQSSKSETTETAPTETAVDGDKLKADLDALLDEIDEVLETNAEAFVKGYVQKGGQ